MGPRGSGKKGIKFYMMVDGQEVEVKPDFAEITFTDTEDQQRNNNPILDNCEFSMQVKLPKSMRCKSRKRFVKLLMASGISRNVAQALARSYVIWSNRIYIPEYLKASYQEYFVDLWMRGLVKPGKAGRADG